MNHDLLHQSKRSISMVRRDPDYALLGTNPGQGVPDDIFQKIAKQFPQYLTSANFIKLSRPTGHPDLKELLEFAKQQGARPQKHKGDIPYQISILDYTRYTKEEIDNSQFVTIEIYEPVITLTDILARGLDFDIVAWLDSTLRKGKNRQVGGMPNLYHFIFVREEAKAKLEQAGLRHLIFRKLKTKSPTGEWPKDIPPLYLLWSDYELPPAENKLFDNDGRVFESAGNRGPFTRGVLLLDGHEMNPKLYYKSLQGHDFDVAHTYERIGNEPCTNIPVYSQKARRALEDLGLDLKLKPVIQLDQ